MVRDGHKRRCLWCRTDAMTKVRKTKCPLSGHFSVQHWCISKSTLLMDISINKINSSSDVRCLQTPPDRHPEPGVQGGEGSLTLGSSDARRSRSSGNLPSPSSGSIGSRKYKVRQVCRQLYFTSIEVGFSSFDAFVEQIAGFHKSRASSSKALSSLSTSCSASSSWRCCSARCSSLTCSVGAMPCVSSACISA